LGRWGRQVVHQTRVSDLVDHRSMVGEETDEKGGWSPVVAMVRPSGVLVRLVVPGLGGVSALDVR
jgi:hypothetical protein